MSRKTPACEMSRAERALWLVRRIGQRNWHGGCSTMWHDLLANLERDVERAREAEAVGDDEREAVHAACAIDTALAVVFDVLDVEINPALGGVPVFTHDWIINPEFGGYGKPDAETGIIHGMDTCGACDDLNANCECGKCPDCGAEECDCPECAGCGKRGSDCVCGMAPMFPQQIISVGNTKGAPNA